MKTFCTIILLLSFGLLFGQTKTKNIPIKPTGDTTFWFNYQKKIAFKIGLAGLDTSTFQASYRIWTNKQVLDISEKQNGMLTGNLTAWTDEEVPGNEKPTNRTFVKSYPLAIDSIQILRDLFVSSGILNLPTDDSITGWQHGFDGVTYIIEYSTKNYYSFKTYWTPKAQDTLSQAKMLQSFVDNVLLYSNAGQTWKSFTSLIPYQCYINGGPAVACKIVTNKQAKLYFKDRQNYRQHRYL